MLSPCTTSSHAISVKAFRWRTGSDYVTRNALAALNNAMMRSTDKATADSRSVESLAIIKNTGHGNFVIGRFHTRARNGSSVWDLPVYSRALPTDTPSLIFSRGRRRLYRGYMERIIPSSKVRRIVYSKLKLFDFQIKTYYLSDANHQTDNPSHNNNPCLVWKRPCLL